MLYRSSHRNKVSTSFATSWVPAARQVQHQLGGNCCTNDDGGITMFRLNPVRGVKSPRITTVSSLNGWAAGKSSRGWGRWPLSRDHLWWWRWWWWRINALASTRDKHASTFYSINALHVGSRVWDRYIPPAARYSRKRFSECCSPCDGDLLPAALSGAPNVASHSQIITTTRR